MILLAGVIGFCLGQLTLLAGLYLATHRQDAQDGRLALPPPEPTLTPPPLSLRRSQGKPERPVRWQS